MDNIIPVINTLLDIIVCGLTGGLASYYYFQRKKRDLLGGFWGGAVIGMLGAVIITYFSGTWFIQLLTWLMSPKDLGANIKIRVNLLAAVIGAFLFVYILNRINHDRGRR